MSTDAVPVLKKQYCNLLLKRVSKTRLCQCCMNNIRPMLQQRNGVTWDW